MYKRISNSLVEKFTGINKYDCKTFEELVQVLKNKKPNIDFNRHGIIVYLDELVEISFEKDRLLGVSYQINQKLHREIINKEREQFLTLKYGNNLKQSRIIKGSYMPIEKSVISELENHRQSQQVDKNELSQRVLYGNGVLGKPVFEVLERDLKSLKLVDMLNIKII